MTGQGVTVAILDAFASPNLFKDARQYANQNDPGHPLRANQFSELILPTNPQLEPPDQCDAAGWYGEQTLDVEAVHAMAPGANILYVGASDCLDISLDKALNQVVSKHLAQIAVRTLMVISAKTSHPARSTRSTRSRSTWSSGHRGVLLLW